MINMSVEEILYNKLYEETKEFERTQFIKEIMRLEREIKVLKESEKNTYETSQEMLKEYAEENQRLKEQLENKKTIFKYYDNLRDELKINNYLSLIKDDKNLNMAFVSFGQYMNILEKENKYFLNQLKQRDEVIEACIKSIEDFMTHIDDGFCADMMTFIDILNKYKGDK